MKDDFFEMEVKMKQTDKMFRNLLVIILTIIAALLYSYAVAGCKDQSADPQDYFIREFELRDGQTFTFYKTNGKEYSLTYDGYTSTGFGRYYWPGEGNNRNVAIVTPAINSKFQINYIDNTWFEVWVKEQTPNKAVLRLSILINGVPQ